MLTKNELAKLKASLPRGYFGRTVVKTTFSERTVAKFFTGEVYHKEIHDAALAVLEEEQSSNSAVLTRHKNLL